MRRVPSSAAPGTAREGMVTSTDGEGGSGGLVIGMPVLADHEPNRASLCQPGPGVSRGRQSGRAGLRITIPDEAELSGGDEVQSVLSVWTRPLSRRNQSHA